MFVSTLSVPPVNLRRNLCSAAAGKVSNLYSTSPCVLYWERDDRGKEIERETEGLCRIIFIYIFAEKEYV